MNVPQAESYWVIDASHSPRNGRCRFIRLYRRGHTATLLSHDEKCDGWFRILGPDGELYDGHQPEAIMSDRPSDGIIIGFYCPSHDAEAASGFLREHRFEAACVLSNARTLESYRSWADRQFDEQGVLKDMDPALEAA
jgi:hypothetical protein